MSDILQITFKGIDPSPELEATIRRKVQALERLVGEPIRLRVVIERRRRRHGQNNPYQVGVEIGVARARIAATSDRSIDEAHEDPYVAVRDAFRAVRRALEHRHDSRRRAARLGTSR